MTSLPLLLTCAQAFCYRRLSTGTKTALSFFSIEAGPFGPAIISAVDGAPPLALRSLLLRKIMGKCACSSEF
jgi:hypothetical protein